MKCIPHLLLTALLFGCSAAESDVKPGAPDLPDHIRTVDNLTVFPGESETVTNINLVAESRYGDTEEAYLGLIRKVLVDNRGRVYLMDSGWGHRGIYVYDSDGSFLKKMGGDGKGPGELLSPRNAGIVDDELFLFDSEQSRINVYSLETLSYSRAHLLDPQKWSHIEALESSRLTQIYFRSDGNYLAAFTEKMIVLEADEDRLIRYYLMNGEGEIISDQVLEQKSLIFLTSGTSAFTLDHDRQSLLTLTTSDDIIGVWTEDFLVRRYTADEGYQSAFYYPYERTPIDPQKILNRYDDAWEHLPDQVAGYKKRIRGAELPEYWPALKSMIVDDENRLWISTVTDDEETFTWWVLEESGKLFTRFTLPRSHTVMEVRKGDAFILIEEGGEEEVIRYRIETGPFDAPGEELN